MHSQLFNCRTAFTYLLLLIRPLVSHRGGPRRGLLHCRLQWSLGTFRSGMIEGRGENRGAQSTRSSMTLEYGGRRGRERPRGCSIREGGGSLQGPTAWPRTSAMTVYKGTYITTLADKLWHGGLAQLVGLRRGGEGQTSLLSPVGSEISTFSQLFNFYHNFHLFLIVFKSLL